MKETKEKARTRCYRCGQWSGYRGGGREGKLHRRRGEDSEPKFCRLCQRTLARKDMGRRQMGLFQ